MRIGFFTDFYHPQINGIAFSIDTFREELEKLGHEVYVFAPSPGLRRYKEKDKRVIRFPAVKGIFFNDYLTSLFFPPQALAKVEKLNLDIIHCHTPSQIGLLGVYFAIHHDKPLVMTYHTDLYEYVQHYPAVLPGIMALSLLIPAITKGNLEEYRDSFSTLKPEKSIDRWNQKIIQSGITLIHNHCDLVITPSLKFEHILQHWHTKSRIETVPTGVVEVPVEAEDVSWAKRHLHEDAKTILSVGRLGREKNVELTIRAFEIVARKDPQTRLLIIGDGPDRKYLQALAAKSAYSSRISFTGQVERHRLGGIYSAASLFVFTSLTDTQGLTLNEAAAAGLPIVIIDHEVNAVVRNGENGYFAKNSAKDVAAKLLAILNKPELHAQMSYRSRQLAAEFLPSLQAEKLLRLYQETIDHHGQKPEKARHRWRPFRAS